MKHAGRCTAASSPSLSWCCGCPRRCCGCEVAVMKISCVSRLAIALLMMVSGLKMNGRSGVSSLRPHSTARVLSDTSRLDVQRRSQNEGQLAQT